MLHATGQRVRQVQKVVQSAVKRGEGRGTWPGSARKQGRTSARVVQGREKREQDWLGAGQPR